MDEYARRILAFVDIPSLRPLNILVNPGNGCAGPALVRSPARFLKFTRMNFTPDGTFPNGIPNPLIVENGPRPPRRSLPQRPWVWRGTAITTGVFLFDETGEFIEGYYLVDFSQTDTRENPGGGIVHDPRLVWNTIELVEEGAGAGHLEIGALLHEGKMRETGAVYGGEMSAHHYFGTFLFRFGDDPLAPRRRGTLHRGKALRTRPLADQKFPCSGEINRHVENPDAVIKAIEEHCRGKVTAISRLDGLSMEFGDTWRFNIRKSNTEPVVRLNVEAAEDESLLKSKTAEILNIIDSGGSPIEE